MNITTLDEIIAKSGEDMFLFSDLITDKLISFYLDELSLSDLEDWIYSDQIIESELKNHYLDLISFDFNSMDVRHQLKKLLRNLYEKNNIEIEFEIVLWLVIRMSNNEYNLIKGCERLARLVRVEDVEFDYSFIPKEYIGLESLIEDLGFYYNPKDQKDIAEKTKLIEEYKNQIRDLNKEFILKITRGRQ